MPILTRGLRGALQPPSRVIDNGSEPRPDRSVSANRKKKRKKQILHAIPVVLAETISFLKESSDCCPPLKSAVGGLSHIIDVVETMKGNKEDAQRLYERAETLLNILSDAISDCTKIPPDMLETIVKLDRQVAVLICLIELERMSREARQLPKKHVVIRFFKARDDVDKLRAIREQLDIVIEDFMLASAIRTTLMLPAINDKTDALMRAILSIQTSSTPLSRSDIHKLVFCLLASSFN
ncbi:hypothetical protein M0805_001850 [Coniferiporia weirii]|nr:hypothetical protein M0805_001850 [Coniferiporia weirii]